MHDKRETTCHLVRIIDTFNSNKMMRHSYLHILNVESLPRINGLIERQSLVEHASQSDGTTCIETRNVTIK